MAARDHRTGGGVRQPHQREDVQAHLAFFAFDVELVEAPGAGEARVVHEHVDRRDAVRDARFDRAELIPVGEIRGEDLARRAVRVVQLLGEHLEPALVARDEHEIVAARGEESRELLTDAGGCARDERGRPGRLGRHRAPDQAAGGGAVDGSSVPFTTMRCAALCFGWHAMIVIVPVGVASVTQMSFGFTMSVCVTV